MKDGATADSPTISVITCTVRPDGLPLVKKALAQQSYRNFEWIIADREGSIPDGLCWTLNRDYNRAIRQAKGDLIISWQDYTYAKPDTLERFWNHYTQNPNFLVTAVGNKYTDHYWTVETWRDPRIRTDQGSFYRCYPQDIEWNLCSVPKKALYAVGGFMEDLDVGYGLDGFCVNQRIDEIGGYDFYIDQTIKSYSLEHARPDDWEEKNLIHEGRYNSLVEKLRRAGKWPVAPYLQTLN